MANRPAAYTSLANVTGGHREAVPREILSFCRLQPQTTGAVILMHLCTSSAVRIPHLHRPWGGYSLVSSGKSTDWPLPLRTAPVG